MERLVKRGLAGPPPSDKKPRTMAPPTEALVIHTLASTEPERPRPEAMGGIKEIRLDAACLECTVQLG